MIEGILSYTRLEEDPGALRFAEIDLGALAEECAALFADAFSKAAIRLSVRTVPTRIKGDYEALRAVVQNLLENALKYSQPDTEVALEVRCDSEKATLRVADQGSGISDADQKRIFDKFYRAGDEMTRKSRGSGLGLALVKRIVDAHAGSIQVRSALNRGTEMTITFTQEGGPHASDPHR
jgi:signal transduction histidine kinase